ncbi:MAG: DUF1700 domain-containing protein [Lachnospiraceae bacterium]|nr:DUF1700 domain-containing protein [Lachnospiraceae bacterium]
MNRVEFMGQLERLLYNLPDEERQDALDYYNDYFDEAGNEHEAEVLRELGSPGRVAALIRAGYQNGAEASQDGEYTENGYQETRFAEHAQTPARYGTSSGQQEGKRTSASEFAEAAADKARSWKAEQDRRRSAARENASNTSEKDETNTGTGHDNFYQRPVRHRRGVGGWVLIIILIIFAAPIFAGTLGGVFGIAGGLLGGAFGIFGACIGLFTGGVISIVRGCVILLTSPGTGLAAIGIGCLFLAVGILLLLFVVWLAFKVLPWFVRLVVNLISRITHHGQSQREGGDQS